MSITHFTITRLTAWLDNNKYGKRIHSCVGPRVRFAGNGTLSCQTFHQWQIINRKTVFHAWHFCIKFGQFSSNSHNNYIFPYPWLRTINISWIWIIIESWLTLSLQSQWLDDRNLTTLIFINCSSLTSSWLLNKQLMEGHALIPPIIDFQHLSKVGQWLMKPWTTSCYIHLFSWG